jgi:hypothetical protein
MCTALRYGWHGAKLAYSELKNRRASKNKTPLIKWVFLMYKNSSALLKGIR